MQLRKLTQSLAGTFLALVLSGCWLDGGQGASSYEVSGQVSGLSGSGLSLALNGGTPLPVLASGPFAFSGAVTGNYSVTVQSQPVGQTCTVTNGSGASGGADVKNVAVTCSSTTFTIGATVSGLAVGSQITLQNNAADPRVVGANGAMSFAVPVAYNSSYSVTVSAQAPGQTCTVSNGTGAGVTADVASVVVTCSAITYTVSGSVSGLAGGAQLTLQNNGADAMILAANGGFAFPTPVAHGGTYAVTVGTQPTGQTCTVTNGSGAVVAGVSNVAVICSTNTFPIGGTVSGLAGGQQLTLRNNGADPTLISTNGAFSFATPVAYGANYAVTVGTQPVNQVCSVSNGSGSGVTAGISNVSITCTTPTISWLYFGDYGANQVLGYSFDRMTGARNDLPGAPYAAGANDRWVASNKARTFFYAANQNANTVSGYTINGTTGALTAIAGSPFATGTTPAAVELSPNGKFAYVTNSNSNTVSGFVIDQTTGFLTPALGSPYATGATPNKMAFTPDSKFVYVSNTNGNQVTGYSIDPTTGALAPVPGAGATIAHRPWSVTVHPSGNYLYTTNIEGTVNAFAINTSTGALAQISGSPFTVSGSFFASLAIHPTGTRGYLGSDDGLRSITIDPATGAIAEDAANNINRSSQNTFVTYNDAGTRLYRGEFITLEILIFDVNATTGALTAVPGGSVRVGARPYNLVVTER
jgi:6-phosphogluconolactonase (cycloisomerase 2 family)